MANFTGAFNEIQNEVHVQNHKLKYVDLVTDLPVTWPLIGFPSSCDFKLTVTFLVDQRASNMRAHANFVWHLY